ncbi:MAG: hypothetical protein ABIR70_22365 [Bryobacteraceae bacterium]
MLPRLLIALLAAISLYGLWSEQLFSQPMWAEEGLRRFAEYAAVFWCVAGLLLWRAPSRVPWIIPVAALYAAWWAGPLAPLAVLFFLGSCSALGKILVRTADPATALLLGAAAWMLILWLALHYPVNYWWTYALAFAVPYIGARPSLALPRCNDRKQAAALAVLLFVLGIHFLAALKPEISADGLSMHLALPAFVADQGQWPFDHQHAIWSLMPAGADALYTGVYLLGGEAASKLLNFAFLAILTSLIVTAARRWNAPYLSAALFLSTPLVQLVTGSLFVENVWAAMLVGATLAVLRYSDSHEPHELHTAGILTGAAVAVKLIAVAFAVPLALLIAIFTWRTRAWKPALISAVAALALALPTYAFAYARSGNPIFPFANAVFRSPDYDATKSFVDPRYGDLHPSWDAPYVMTFRSDIYVEGQGGAAGFQYFILLLPAALLVRRRDQAVILTVCAMGTAIVLLAAPNLRYTYAALPLASLAIAWLPLRAAAIVGLTALNLWFLPASGYYNPDFALYSKADIRPFLEAKAPVRLLIDRLNLESPGEPVAFFSTDATAELHAKAYTDTWHNEHYWERVRNAPDAAAIAEQFRKLGIRHVIAPATREAPFEVVKTFLTRWLDPEPNGSLGALALYRVRDSEIPIPKDTRPLEPGTHDDTEPRIEYSGAWLHDKQFAEPVGQSLSYSDVSGDTLHFTFAGPAITYVYTLAANRGIGEVVIDGRLAKRLNQYAANTQWQSSARIAGLAQGVHTFELRVTGRKDRKSTGNFVDLDAVRVE